MAVDSLTDQLVVYFFQMGELFGLLAFLHKEEPLAGIVSQKIGPAGKERIHDQ